MNTRRLRVSDARQKISRPDARSILNKISTRSKTITSKPAVKLDARNKLNSLTKVKSHATAFDARIKIKGSGSSKPSSTQDVKKVGTQGTFSLIKTLVVNNAKDAGTTRTIRNPSAISIHPKKENVGNILKQKPSGFISVTGESRVLMDKVTVEPAGMKIMVRNDSALTTKPTTQNQTEQKGARKGLRITMSNPDALKKQIKPTKPNIPVARRLPRKRPIQTRQLPANLDPITMSSVKQHLQASVATKPKLVYNTAKRLKLSQINARPMISTKNVEPKTPANHIEDESETLLSISSPFEGTKIVVSNLHPVVVEEDILELFSVLGPVRRARLIGSGKAEIVFIRRDDAIRAYQKYNNRDLDGQPMRMKLLLQEATLPSINYSWQSEIKSNPKLGSEIVEIEPNTLQRALFKGGSTGSSTRPVVFTVKI